MENTTQSIHAEKKFTASINNLYDAWINGISLNNGGNLPATNW